jgi:TolB-like protein
VDLSQPRPRLALVPLENLTGRGDAGEGFSRILFVELVRKGTFEVVDLGDVETAMDSLRIRPTASLSGPQRQALGDRLSVAYVMVGSLLESGSVRTPDGDVPSASVALKLLEVGSGRVAWARMAVRSGDDHESVFGWGRQLSPQKLAAALAVEALADLRVPAAGADTKGGKP